MKLVPYVQIDGEWTVPAGIMAVIWREIERDSLHKVTFYDGSIQTAEQFIQYMQSGKTLPVVAFSDAAPMGFAWLTEINGFRAFAHFCMLRIAWGSHSREIARQILDYWWSLASDTGPVLQLIMGMTPEANKPALRFIRQLGFNIVGTVPKICRGVDGPMPGVLSYIERPE